jgi:hypothetical protein
MTCQIYQIKRNKSKNFGGYHAKYLPRPTAAHECGIHYRLGRAIKYEAKEERTVQKRTIKRETSEDLVHIMKAITLLSQRILGGLNETPAGERRKSNVKND